jgi:hypothetical protein
MLTARLDELEPTGYWGETDGGDWRGRPLAMSCPSPMSLEPAGGHRL